MVACRRSVLRRKPLTSNTQPFIKLAAPRGQRPADGVIHRETRPAMELLSPLRRFHPNILIVDSGVEVERERALAEIRPILRLPLTEWWPREMPDLPAIAFRSLIVRDAECLNATQQRSLAALLRRAALGQVQIVSIASVPLYPLVCQGLFLEELYYRLNVVLLEPNHGQTAGWLTTQE